MRIERKELMAFVLLFGLVVTVAFFLGRPATSEVAEAPTQDQPQPTASATATPPADRAAMVPLGRAVADLHPQDLWQSFLQLTRIPRPSHHEEQVRELLVQLGKDLGLETIVDDVGNVLIRKPASPGMEDRHGVILQAHMDIVPQKTSDHEHDFLTDPIEAYVAGEWIVTDGTTLGADDGIGIAMAMTALQSPTLGPIEALFTVNEEDGMDGVLGLEADLLQGDILINLDSEEEGVFTISSAGFNYGNIDTTYLEVMAPDGTTAVELAVRGLEGGHSATDIDKGRGHATKLLVRLLSLTAQHHGLRLARLEGGTAANAIPSSASALVVVPEARAEEFEQYVQQFEGMVRSELVAVDPNVEVRAVAAEPPAKVMDPQAQRTLIDALHASPQGVIRMSDVVPGLVETSTNMGVVHVADGKLTASFMPRSSVDTQLEDVSRMIVSVWDLADIEVHFGEPYLGWRANPDSPILRLMQSVYEELYDRPPEILAAHFGLECGTIVGKYPGMDTISIGPTTLDVHSPNERLLIASVEKVYDLLLETLRRIPVRP